MNNRRNGVRKSRDKTKTRQTNLKHYHYIIVTDTDKTEKNYMEDLKNYIEDLKNSMPNESKSKISIKTHKTETKNLINKMKTLISLDPQYKEPWIVFDKDQVNYFDKIIEDAQNEGIKVGWSNPCIEIWFHAYLGSMPTCKDSVECVKKFKDTFKKKTKKDYKKAEKNIYTLLCKYGDENKAIKIADLKLSQQKQLNKKPSDMCPATTLHLLIKEIKNIK